MTGQSYSRSSWKDGISEYLTKAHKIVTQVNLLDCSLFHFFPGLPTIQGFQI